MDDTTATTTEDAPTSMASSPVQSQSEVLLSMEGLIKNHLSALRKLQGDLTKQKEMLDDILANDPTYQEHLNAANEASKTKNTTKAQVLKQPQAADLDKKIKDIKVEMKENSGSLSDYLSEYSRLSGLTEIEDDEGNMMQISFSAKLIKR
jgi:hypothetical protein